MSSQNESCDDEADTEGNRWCLICINTAQELLTVKFYKYLANEPPV